MSVETTLAPIVKITIAGNEYKLVFDFNAVCDVEEVTGQSMLENAFWTKFTGKKLRAMLWAALQLHHSKLFAGEEGLRGVGKLISTKNATAVQEACIQAWTCSKPPADPTDAPITEPVTA
jgi:hypothetical protein